jgi:Icc-related predicted phosphoesterase
VRVLGVSDIHSNVRALEKLRSLERNEFNLVVLGGDIGDDNAGATEELPFSLYDWELK